ncbi:MAG: dienelactone hydrolase family protein [Clostridia bacterium]|nr:dienelactone hydrolase family protein [Clostridia bacterium]
MNYTEDKINSKEGKEEYVNNLLDIIEKRQEEAKKIRRDYISDIFSNQEKYRNDFKEMLGWPLVNYKAEGAPKVTLEKLFENETHESFRMSLQVLEGLSVSGLFFKVKSKEAKPLVLVQHGGLGTPEFIAGFYGGTSNYNDMLERVASNGVHVFATQLLLWDKPSYEVDFNRENIDARLKRVGSSITAIEVFALTRILDYFEDKDYVKNFGMVGMSYGGFYTLFTTAVDTRIKSAVSSSFFNTRDKVGWSDWVWHNSAYKFDDAEVACLVYPRRIHLAIGDNDELFNYKHSEKSFEEIKEICKEVGTDWVKLQIYEGTHEFIKDDEAINTLINDLNK